MNKRMLALAILLTGAVTTAWTRGGEGSWDNVLGLAPGTRVQVVDLELKSFTGAVQAVGDEVITVRTKGGDVTVNRAEVYRVSLRQGSHRGRNALIGAAIGAGTGIAIGLPLDLQGGEEGEYLHSMFLGMIGAGAGTAIGAMVPGYATLYRAERP